MPVYCYKCPACEARKELLRPISKRDDPVYCDETGCPSGNFTVKVGEEWVGSPPGEREQEPMQRDFGAEHGKPHLEHHDLPDLHNREVVLEMDDGVKKTLPNSRAAEEYLASKGMSLGRLTNRNYRGQSDMDYIRDLARQEKKHGVRSPGRSTSIRVNKG